MSAHLAVDAAAHHGLLAQLALAFEVLADAVSRLDDRRHAARLLGAADRLRHELGAHGAYPIHHQRRTQTIKRARAALGTDGYLEAFTEGGGLSWDEAVAFIQRARGERKRPAFGWDAITPTEHRIIDAVTHGLTNTQIARQLLMSPETVKSHLSHIYTKLGVNNRARLVAAHRRLPPAPANHDPGNGSVPRSSE
jgi:DNA-binding CsgD family transcriptional regulator